VSEPTRLDVVGYADPLCVVAGEKIAVAVSSRSERYHAELVRLGGDERAAVTARPQAWELVGERVGRMQRLERGSYLRVDDAGAIARLDAFSLVLWLQVTSEPGRARGIASFATADPGRSWRLGLDARNRLAYWHDGRLLLAASRVLEAHAWCAVHLVVDRAEGTVRIGWTHTAGGGETAAIGLSAAAPPHDGAPAELLLAAGHGLSEGVVDHLNGKLEQPCLYREALSERALERPDLLSSPYAAWILAPGGHPERAPDAGPAGLHGELVNGPTRCVTGHLWRGHEVDWRRAPWEYAAVHFHDDDLDDARWEADLRWRVPEDAPSGVYAVRLRGAAGEDHVPFVVSPSQRRPAHDVAVLIPTFSYLAYANEHNGWHAPTFEIPGLPRESLLARVTPQDRFAAEQRLLSLYELHSDGSGVCLSSSRRPLMNMRPWYRMPLIDSPHQLGADLELLAWLESAGFEHDVLTDHHLHAVGVEALRRHRVVVLGSHPEYRSEAMLDALAQYLDDGGRVMYLGGNGLYWVTAQDPDRPWLVEVRRGHNGTRCWTSAPGDVHLQSTGEIGGLWRHRGRAPQRLVGLGFTAQGFDASRPYEATAAARDPRAAFLFDGIDLERPIGDAGSVLGGAGGFELDRADVLLGTPRHALVVAQARGHSASYQAAVEEIEVSDSLQGGPVNERVRSDVVFYETPSGGAVFSTGSIAWCGALGANGGDNAAARLTANALRGFVSLDFATP